PGVGHARDPADDTEREALENQVIDAAEDIEAVAEGVVEVGDATDVAGLFLYSHDLGNLRQPFEGRNVHIDLVGDGVVVDHDRQAAGGDGLVPLDGLAAVGTIGEAGEDHQAFGAELSVVLRSSYGVLRGELGEPGEQRHAAGDGFPRRGDDL